MPIILLNEESPRIRRALPRRAAIAHEVCHLLHDSGEHDVTTQLSWGENSQDSAIEQRARGFAPALLAPRDDVRHWFKVGGGKRLRSPDKKVLALAKRWGLSYGGAAWHAKNCQLIRDRTAQQLANTAPPGRQDWEQDFEPSSREPRPSEDEATSPLVRGLLLALVREAQQAGVISEGRAGEILNWGHILAEPHGDIGACLVESRRTCPHPRR